MLRSKGSWKLKETLSPEEGQSWPGPEGGFIVVQLPSQVQLFVTPCTIAHWASLFLTISLGLLKLMSIESGCYPVISSSVIPFSCLQPFLVLGSFPMSQLFTSGNQSIRTSASAISPSNVDFL